MPWRDPETLRANRLQRAEFGCFSLIRALHLHPERGSQEPVAPLERHSMFRILSFCCLLLCLGLGGISGMTLDSVDSPVTDPLLFGFIKSDRYLPPGDSISRVELYSPAQKLLAEDRRAYKGILVLSGVAFVSAFGLFVSSGSRKKHVEPTVPQSGGPAASVDNSNAPGGPPW
jgi:hypothetical protein